MLCCSILRYHRHFQGRNAVSLDLAFDLMSAPTILNVNPWDIFFSVLPVHHTYECTCAFLMPLYKGAASRIARV